MEIDFNGAIKWVENTIQIYNELLKDKERQQSRHDAIFYSYNLENLTLIKEYLNDYEKLAKDYQKLSNKNKLLRLKIMELESQKIYEDMKKDYRANRRKWLSR
jgi:gp18